MKSFFLCFLFSSFIWSTGAQETSNNLLNVLGASGLTAEERDGGRIIKVSGKSVNVNNQKVNLDGLEFFIHNTGEGDEITLNGTDQKFRLIANDQALQFIAGENSVTINDETIAELTEDGQVAFTILAAILGATKDKGSFEKLDITTGKYGGEGGGTGNCQLAQITFGAGRSTAEGRCMDKADKFLAGHKDCRQEGSCDTSCLYANHVCFSTTFFRCSGASCPDNFLNSWMFKTAFVR